MMKHSWVLTLLDIAIIAPCLIVIGLGMTVSADLGIIVVAFAAFIFFALPFTMPLAIGVGFLAAAAGTWRLPFVGWSFAGAILGLLVGGLVESLIAWGGQSLIWICCGVGLVVAIIERWNWSE